MSPTSAFGDLLRQYRARKAALSQTRLAHLAGYDQAVLVRMSQGKKDLTGPSGREWEAGELSELLVPFSHNAGARAKAARLVTLTGTPGIGPSRYWCST